MTQRLIDVPSTGYPSRDCHRTDCCDNCLRLDTCAEPMMRRCFPRGEFVEQCQTCKPCESFVQRPESPFVTAYDMLHAGGSLE
jgi:hypothetical protein